MERNNIKSPRKNWKSEMEAVGFTYHTIDGEKYWTEDSYYKFSKDQIEHIYEVSKELSNMCFEAVQYVIDNNLFDKLKLSPESAELIRRSWEKDDPTLYGRFDLGWDGVGDIKLFEYNADTPTSLMEASVAQHYWRLAYFPKADQYNGIHEALTDQFLYIKGRLPIASTLYFSCIGESEEDVRTVYYLHDVAKEAGLKVKYINISDIGHNGYAFVDLDEQPIEHMFKLYPWEWMEHEDFAEFAFRDMKTWIEPIWKMVLSNKGILPILWEMYPNHPNLLEAYFDDGSKLRLKEFVRKPIFSREGANIEMHTSTGKLSSDGDYGEEGHIIQKLHMLPNFEGRYPVIGSWIVGDTACGIGIREDDTPITKNTSRFIPHIFI